MQENWQQSQITGGNRRKAVDKGKMYICYHSRISSYVKDTLEAFGYTTYEQTDLAPDGEFRGYITYIKW